MTDVVVEHIKDLIKTEIKDHKDPYLKCFVLEDDSDLDLDFNDKDTQNAVRQACETLMNELQFRFKIVFKPECCMLRAYKLHLDTDYERLWRRNNYARFASF